MASAANGDPEAQSRTQRLSKPRTNTSSSNLLLLKALPTGIAPCGAASEGSRSSDELQDSKLHGERRRSRRKSMVRIASYFKRSSTEDEQCSDYDSPSLISSEDVPYSQQKSSVTATSRNPSQLDMRTASCVSLNDEESKRLLDEFTIKEKAVADTMAALTHVPPPVDDDKHPDSLKSPIRRKSLYTPGIATRTPHDILRKPPPPSQIQSPADRAYYYNSAYSERSPLACLASLEMPNHGRSTPCDLDRTHLGGLSLGTLRVTNGTASPEPPFNPANLRPLSSSRSDDDYYTASEGTHSDHENGMGKNARRNRRDLIKLHQRSQSPLKYPSQPIEVELTFAGSRRSSWSSPLEESLASEKQILCNPDDGASAIALDYMSEIPDSPYKAFGAFNQFERQTQIEGEAAGITPSWKQLYDDPTDEPSGMITSARSEEANVLETCSADDAFQTTHMVDNANPTDKMNENRVSYEQIPDPMISSCRMDSDRFNPCSASSSFGDKTDSGYVSDVSGRMHAQPEDISDENLLAQDYNHSADHSGMGGVDTCRQGLPIESAALQTASGSSIPPTAPVESPRKVIARPSLPSTSSWRLSLPASMVSRRLQKVRRTPQPPLTDWQLAQDLSQSQLPQIPPELVTRMSQRADEFPLLEQACHKLNVGDDCVASGSCEKAMPLRFPSAASQTDEQTDFDRRIDSICRSDLDWPGKKSKKKEDAKKSKIIASPNKEKKKSKLSKAKKQTLNPEAKATIADFGTVTESLGKSPYDIALDTIQPRVRIRSLNRAPQPFRMSTSIPRQKRVIGMNDQEAAEYARINNERYRRRSSSFAKPERLALAKAEDNSFFDVSRPRPTSMFADIPPLPSLPLAKGTDEGIIDYASAPRPASALPRYWPNERSKHQVVRTPTIAKISPSTTTTTSPSNNTNNIRSPISRPRPRSMYADVPPMPGAVVEYDQIQHNNGTSDALQASQYLGSNPVPVAPTDCNKSVTDLDNAAGKGDQDDSWTQFRSAWSQRRRSAGEALLKQQKFSLEDRRVTEPTYEYCTEPSEKSPALAVQASNQVRQQDHRQRGASAPPKERFSLVSATAPPGLPPLEPSSHLNHLQESVRTHSGVDTAQASLPTAFTSSIGDIPSSLGTSTSTSTFNVPRKRVASHVNAFEALSSNPPDSSFPALPPPPPPKDVIEPLSSYDSRFKGLAGRYEGGLLYGYEPGFGLGGSAGTRTPRTGATRKSVGVSSAFGVDLSDVPVFVGRI